MLRGNRRSWWSWHTACAGYTTIDGPYHPLENEGHVFGDPPSADDFELLFNRSVSLLRELHASNVLFDRSPADYLCLPDGSRSHVGISRSSCSGGDSAGFDVHLHCRTCCNSSKGVRAPCVWLPYGDCGRRFSGFHRYSYFRTMTPWRSAERAWIWRKTLYLILQGFCTHSGWGASSKRSW